MYSIHFKNKCSYFKFILIVLFASFYFANVCQAMQPTLSEKKAFSKFLLDIRAQAKSEGITETTLKKYLDKVELLPNSLHAFKNQKHTQTTFDEYKSIFLDKKRLTYAQEQYRTHYSLLNEIAQKYSVNPEAIVALWSMETNAGRFTGKFSEFSALATLAFEGRRRQFFTKELIAALQIAQQYQIPAEKMLGSSDGGMGQSQFMPTSYQAYAVDYDNSGFKDIWNTKADVFASIANYLNKAGWKINMPWGIPVSLPKQLDSKLASLQIKKTYAEWLRLGLTPLNLSTKLNKATKASLVITDKKNRTAFLVTENFYVFRKWNRPVFFAITAGLLSNQIAQQS